GTDGKFTLENGPAGIGMSLYAETTDHSLAGYIETRTSPGTEPTVLDPIKLAVTVSTELIINNAMDKPQPNLSVRVVNLLSGQEGATPSRSVRTDAQGKLKLTGIVPGMHYRLRNA